MKNPLETKVRERSKKIKIQDNITLLIARLTSQSGRNLFVPDDVLVRRLGLKSLYKQNASYRVRESLKRLADKGIISYKRSPEGWSAHITAAGMKYAEQLEILDRIDIQKPRTWDGKWRVVMFDIWERRRSMRDKLRGMLQKAGFYKVQNSVWVHPYDCEDLIVFLRTEMRLGRGVIYMIADGIEGDSALRDHFRLR